MMTLMKSSEGFDAAIDLGILRKGGFLAPPSILPGVVRVIDTVAILLSATVATAFFAAVDQAGAERQAVCVAAVLIFYHMIASLRRLYALRVIANPVSRTDGVILALSAAVLMFLGLAAGFGLVESYASWWLLAFAGLSVPLLLTGRVLAWPVFRRLGEQGVIGRSIAVLGVGEQSQRFLRRLKEAQPYFFSVTGVYETRRGESDVSFVEGHPILGDVAALLAHARKHKIDDVVLAFPWSADRQVAATVETLRELPINIYLSSDLTGCDLAYRPELGNYRELPIFEVVQRPISGWSAALKAVEDYALATVALILISPLLVAIAIAIKFDSPGPVFFMQERLGFNNKVFRIYKFRSMFHRKTAEATVVQAQKKDPRVTRVGRFIRATSLDELPQLLNVLNGTMSLVGPRPHALSHNKEYGAQIRGYFARHRVKPGITGWAQVNGLRGETRELEKMEARIRHDIHYADNWSLLFDLRILFVTAFVVPFQKEAY